MAKAAKNEEEKLKTTEDAAGEEGGEVHAPVKKSKKKLIIIAAIAVLLIGGGAAAFVMTKKSAKTAEGETAVVLDEHGKPVVDKPVYYTLPEFLVNLNATGKSSQFLKATVILEVAKTEDVALIEANLPRLVDGINTYLREMRSSDVAGSAGIQRLREEILLRVNKAIAPTKINDVLFKEIVVQ